MIPLVGVLVVIGVAAITFVALSFRQAHRDILDQAEHLRRQLHLPPDTDLYDLWTKEHLDEFPESDRRLFREHWERRAEESKQKDQRPHNPKRHINALEAIPELALFMGIMGFVTGSFVLYSEWPHWTALGPVMAGMLCMTAVYCLRTWWTHRKRNKRRG